MAILHFISRPELNLLLEFIYRTELRGRKDLKPLIPAVLSVTVSLIRASLMQKTIPLKPRDHKISTQWESDNHFHNYLWQTTIIHQHMKSEIIMTFHRGNHLSSACTAP